MKATSRQNAKRPPAQQQQQQQQNRGFQFFYFHIFKADIYKTFPFF